nr:hypothetical protein [Tanacetum cinerariifolium]
KANLETIESLKSKGFESSENVSSESENQNENDCLVDEKECDKEENPKVIAPGIFKLNVSQCVSPISMSKSSCDSNNVEIKLKRKRHLDTFSSVRRPKNSGVIWKKKGSSNTSNVGLSAMSVLNLNKNVKRYSRKDLLACNNSHLGETSSAYVCNDAMNSIPINVIPIGDEASTSHYVFNERLEDAYFDASTSFHDPSNVHTYYQPYPHEKKWTKDHPLHKIIGDLKSSVRTRGQLANLCLFSCLLSSIEPANVADALRDADWVNAMQEELDQFERLKVWRLVPRPEGKSVIKTKWIFKNKKDESSFVSKQYPDHVYALDKALYGLKQAPRAWYGILSQFLIESGFQKEKAGEDDVQQYVLFPVWSYGSNNPQNTDGDAVFEVKEPEFEGRKPESEVHVSLSSSAQSKKHDYKTKREPKGKIPTVGQISTNNTNTFSVVSPLNAAVSPTHGNSSYMDTSQLPDDPNMPELEDITYSDDEEDVATQTRSMSRVAQDQGGLSQINNNDFHTCMFTCFFSQEEPKKVHQALKDPSWIEAMQEELLQFKMQKVWVLVDLPHGKRAIGHTQEEGIDYEEVFTPVLKIEAIRLFLAYASFMGFMVYQMDVKSAFLYGTTEEEVYICQPSGFEDPDYPDKVYKVVKALYGLHQAPRAWYETLANYILENGFQRGKIDQPLFIKRQKAFKKLMKDKFQTSSIGELTFFLGLQVKQKQDRIFISQDKYVAGILRKFGLTDRKSASTPIDTEKPLLKDLDGEDVDVHTYRSMIGSLMYLTSSRPDIMFAVCVCAPFQVTPKASHLHAVKRIFRYLKGKPHLGLWYPKDSPFNLVAYSDSDYAGASLDKKSTTKGINSLDAD